MLAAWIYTNTANQHLNECAWAWDVLRDAARLQTQQEFWKMNVPWRFNWSLNLKSEKFVVVRNLELLMN